MLKKLVCLVLGVSLIAVAAPALGAARATISYWGWITPEWVAIYREFEKQNPNVKIRESLISQEWASTSEKFLAAMAAGNAPDVSLQNRHQFKQWSSRGPFYDLTEFVK